VLLVILCPSRKIDGKFHVGNKRILDLSITHFTFSVQQMKYCLISVNSTACIVLMSEITGNIVDVPYTET
jgi:hypothetical protein